MQTSKTEAKSAQVWIYKGLVGDGWQVTDHKNGVWSFKPFAGGLLFLAGNPERSEKKERSSKYGSYQHFEQEDSPSALYYTSLAALRQYENRQRAATEDEAKELVRPVVELTRLLPSPLHIVEMIPAPDSKAVYLNCQRREDFVYWRDTSVFCLQLDAKAALAEFIRGEPEKKNINNWDTPSSARARITL